MKTHTFFLDTVFNLDFANSQICKSNLCILLHTCMDSYIESPDTVTTGIANAFCNCPPHGTGCAREPALQTHHPTAGTHSLPLHRSPMVPKGKGLSTDAHSNHQNRIFIVQVTSDLCHRLTHVNTSFSISAFDSSTRTLVGSKGNTTHQTCKQIHILSVARQMCEWSGYIRVRENFSDTADVCSCPRSSESQLAAPLHNPFITSPWHLTSQKSATLLV